MIARGFFVIAWSLIACCLVFLPLRNSVAAIDVYEFPDQETERRFRELNHELRCPKCQNQNINDSNAPLAKDIKDRVHDLLIQGKTNQEITDFMIERYGEFVTYRPQRSIATVLLWTVPAAIGVLALLALVWRRRASSNPEAPRVDPDKQAQLDALLKKYSEDAARSDRP